MILKRQIKYYFLKFMRLKGEPHELALGIASGVFASMFPIPCQMALAVVIAFFLKASKLAAALGTWVTNPLDWAIVYYFTYKLGSFVLGFHGKNAVFRSVIDGLQSGEDTLIIIKKMLGAGGICLASFLVGGVIAGISTAVPSYFISLLIFRRIKTWRELRKKKKFIERQSIIKDARVTTK